MSPLDRLRSDGIAEPGDPHTLLGEQHLVELVRAGDVRAFERIFAFHYASLCSFVDSYVHSEAVAEDLVSDLFRRIWEQRDRWSPTKSVASYLFGAARNRALDHLKHQRIERDTAEVLKLDGRTPGMGARLPSADAEVGAAELDAAIKRAIEALPERCRTAFTLRRRQHMSYVQIAEVMGTTIKTVEVQIGLALKALRKSLADWLD